MSPRTAPPTDLARLLADCEAICHAGTLQISDDGQVHLSDGLMALLGVNEPAAGPLDQLPWIPEAERRLVAHLWQHATPGEPFDIQHHVLTTDGQRLSVHHRGLRSSDGSARPAGHAVLRDVTPLKDFEQRIDELTHAHETTGLPNRAWLINRLENAVATSGGDGRGFSLLSIAVPRITELAGSMGYGAADALATALAARLSEMREPDEWIAQLAAAEFALVIRHPSTRSCDETGARAAEVLRALQAPVSLGVIDIFPTCRIGISVYPADGASAWQLLESAQAARTDAAHGAELTFHSPQATAHALRDILIETRLRQALSNNEFALAYQPQVCLKTGAIIGVEALLRWQPGHGETFLPEEFLPVAERSGLVARLGDWVIHEACAQAVRWRDAGLPAMRTAINLSPVQFQIGDVEQTLHHAMQATGALPTELCLEVTESALLDDADRVSATLRKLQQAGMEIALDDFGTGYSSLSRLRSLPIDVLKIDRAFVKDVAAEADSAAVIRAIIHLAHSLRIRVLAEGVETEGQLAMVLSSGCDQLQGFFFAPPAPPEEINRLLRERKQLPPEQTLNHALRRTLLLVDDEENILSALKRVFRRDGYRVLTANSGPQALELLATTEVDVIVSDQRMPGMAGVDFLRKAKELWPDTIRMTLSGFTDLQSIIDAVNEGAVFKFLTKPWDDARLREHVAQAFRQKEMADENRRLNQKLASAGAEQAALNRRLEALLERQRVDADLAEAGAGGVRELLELLPAAVVGVDPDGMLVFLNQRASALFPQASAHLGCSPDPQLQALMSRLREPLEGESSQVVKIGPLWCRGWWRHLDEGGHERGDMMVLMPCCQADLP